jgi:hypothetical protein
MSGPHVYYPLDEIVDPGMLPFGDLLDEVLAHIWIANPSYDPATTQGVVDVLVDKAVEIPVPGVSALTLALGDQVGAVDATLRARFTPAPAFSVEVPLTLRVDSSVLRPMKGPTGDDVDPDRATLDITLGVVRVGFDADGGFILDLPAGLTLPRCMIGSTGVIVSAKNVRWLYPGAPNLPATVPPGFSGLHLDDATVEITSLPVDLGQVELTDAYLGTGGFSGTVAWSDPTLSWDGSEFQGIAAGELFGFAGALHTVGLTFRQNALTGCDIQGDVYLPYLEKRIGVDLALDGRGGISAMAGLPTSSPPEPKVGPGSGGALLHLDLNVLKIDLDELRFTGGGSTPAAVSLTGKVTLDIEAVNSPAFSFKHLTIDTAGHVTIEGGWLDIEYAKSADVHGFALEITRIGFGSLPDGRAWFGLNGGLKLAAGLPVGVSVEGLKVSWDPRAVDPLGSLHVSLEGVGLTLEVPNAFSFKGSVALFSGDPVFGDGFTGHIALAITPVKVAIDAVLMVGRTADGLDYFFVYLGVDLPTGIPLFSTGASIYGFAGLVAVNMRPDRHGDESWWHGWYMRPPRGVLEPRKKWTVQKGAFAIGLGTTIGTGADDGFAVNVKVLLILSLPGPVIFLQGKGNFISLRSDSQKPDAVGIFETLLVLDIPAKLFSANLAAAYTKEGLVTIAGEADAAFSWAKTPPPDLWHLYVGEKEPPERRVRGVLLELLKFDTYFQLRESGIQLGGRIGFDGDWSLGPARAWVHAHLQLDAGFGFKPPQLDASLSIQGDAGIEAFGAKVLIVLEGSAVAKGPDPWYLGIHVHLELKIDLWFFHWSVEFDAPLEWGDLQSPKPLPASPVITSIGAVHPKVSADLAVLDRATIPPDGRPVVVFSRPVLDAGMIGTPNTGALAPDTVGAWNFSYQLGHVVLAAGSGANRRLVGASGMLDVVGTEVTLPAELALPDVAGATLSLLPGPTALPVTTLPVTGRTATGIAIGGGAPVPGRYAYRLTPPPVGAAVQVTAVAAGPLGVATVTLAADPQSPVNAFAGGTLALGGASWTVLASAGGSVTVATPGAAPGIGTGQLTGPPAPELRGSWLPTADRGDASDPGPTTTLMLWARTPFAWFRGSSQETVDGFDAHNPDYACGPAPVEEPICADFTDLPPGDLVGDFQTELLHGTATGTVRVGADHHLLVGTTAAGRAAHGVAELRFDPPVDWLRVRCSTAEAGTLTVLREGGTVARLPVPRKGADLVVTGTIDTVRVEGTLTTVERICFTPGWTCVPFQEASFPQGSTGEQSYAGLTVYSCSAMQVVGDELWVDPVSLTWPIPGGIVPQQPSTVAVISVRLPQPVTRVRFRVTADCLAWVGGGGQQVAQLQATAGQTVAVSARDGAIDQIAISAATRIGMSGPCFDAGPFGWQRWEQWSWRNSMRAATQALSTEDPVLAPGEYTLSVLAGVETSGADQGMTWEPQQDAVFTVGVPPGLTTPTGDADADRRYPAGGPLADLGVYVDTTVPVAGERPAYRAYDVGVAFTEPYVSRMFLAAAADLTVAVTDPNGVDRRAGAPNLWGRGPEVRLGEQETRFVKTLHGDGSQLCAPVDLSTVVRDEGISAGAGELLAPATQHVAELRAAGHDKPAYRFAFTTSRFADFRHHLAYADGRARVHVPSGGAQADVPALSAALDAAAAGFAAAVTAFGTARAAATTGTPTVAQLDAYPVARATVRAARAALAAAGAAGFDALWAAAAAAPPDAGLPDGVELTYLAGLGGVLLESAEPVRWERTAVDELATATVTPLRTVPLDVAAAGNPDQGAFRWAGLDAHTDAELRTHLGTLAPKAATSWTLDLTVPRTRRVRLRVAVAAGGTATLTGTGTAVSAPASTGPAGDATLEVSGTDLATVRLAGSGVTLLGGTLDRPFEPVPATGPLRLARAVLGTTHSIDVTASADVALAGHTITWYDALSPADPQPYHAFAAGTTVADGRTARVYGGSATTPADGGVDLYAGGTAGTPPPTGVVFRLHAPDGTVLHELCALPDSAFTTAGPVRVFPNADQTRAILLPPAPLPAGFTRLRLTYQRDPQNDLPRLSVGGVAGPESASLNFVLHPG